MQTNRPTWGELALILAWSATLRSQDWQHKVGAVALNYENRVIGVAYNGLASGKEVDQNFWEDRDKRRPYMVHAEVNLASLFKVGECKLLAVTACPCSSCATLIAANKIPEVVYSEEYLHDMKGLEVLDFYGIKHTKIPKEHILKLMQNV